MAAPAIIRAESLMRVSPIIVPPSLIFAPPIPYQSGNRLVSVADITREALAILVAQMAMSMDYREFQSIGEAMGIRKLSQLREQWLE